MDGPASPGELDQRGRALLDFEREWPTAGSALSKEEAILATFGFTKANYHKLLARIVDSPAAYAYDPLTVLRLRRRREQAGRRRTGEALRERR